MSVTIHRWALAAAICGIGAAAALAQSPSLAGDAVRAPAPAVPTLNIGVRYDAPPFSYSDPRLIEAPAQRQRGADAAPSDGSDPGYRGYVVQICRSILADMPEQQGWTSDNVVFVEINAQNRFEMLRNAEIDILCDPATITRDRLARSDRPLMASLPIYMSAVTFAAPRTPPLKDQCQSIVGVVSETTAFLPGLRRIIDAGNWPRHAAQVRKALISANFDAPVLPDSDCVEVVIKRYRTHDELAEDFCKGDTLYYVG
jgi:ABC-type amino acid transport substrate-binding protein